MADSIKSRSSRRPSRKRSSRLLLITVAVGALLVLVISAVLNWPVGEESGIGASGKEGAAPAPRQVFEAPPGSCLSWHEADAGDIRQVTCEEPHLFEVTGTSDLRDAFDDNAPFPDTAQWQQLKAQRCAEVSERFLDGRFDPLGRFTVGAFTPSEQGWSSGDRVLHCGMQQPGPSGRLYRTAGSVARLDQSNTYPPGRCLGINGTSVWDPTDCAQPHSVEITGTVDLGDRFHEEHPSEGVQDGYLATRCAEVTSDYAGSPTAAGDKGLVAYWDTLSQPSWDAGSRQVNCKVSAQLPDGSGLAPVTGSVRSEVSVDQRPAPPNAARPEPGVPAAGDR